jgi:hypothetical protein
LESTVLPFRFLFGFAAPAIIGLTIVMAVSMRSPDGAPAEPRLHLVEAGVPVEICLETDDQASHDLATGKRRPVLVVTSYDPPTGSRSVIEVTSSVTGMTSRIGLFPDKAFTAASPEDARRFFLPSVKGDQAATECFIINLLVDKGVQAGSMTVKLELSPSFEN